MLTTEENRSYSLALVSIAILSMLANIILVSVISKIQERKREVNLAILMGVVDTLLPIAAIITGLTNYFDADEPDFILVPCYVKGTFDYIMIPLSIALGCIISVERCSRVLGKPVPLTAQVLFLGYNVFYFFLVVVAGSIGEFQPSASGLNCAPKLDTLFSSTILFLLGFNLFLYLSITLISYGLIIHYANSVFSNKKLFLKLKPAYGQQYHIDLKSKAGLQQLWQRRSFTIRILSTCLIYLIFLAPLSILIMMEATSVMPNPQVGSITISIFIGLTAISSPILVLFAHSVIYQQFKKSFLEIIHRRRH